MHPFIGLRHSLLSYIQIWCGWVLIPLVALISFQNRISNSIHLRSFHWNLLIFHINLLLFLILIILVFFTHHAFNIVNTTRVMFVLSLPQGEASKWILWLWSLLNQVEYILVASLLVYVFVLIVSIVPLDLVSVFVFWLLFNYFVNWFDCPDVFVWVHLLHIVLLLLNDSLGSWFVKIVL